MKRTVLVANDEFLKIMTLGQHLRQAGMDILTAHDAPTALALIQSQPIDAFITDLRTPDLDGIALVEKCRTIAPDLPVLVITGYSTVQDAVRAMQAGAIDYLVKPLSGDEVILRLERAFEIMAARQENRRLKEELGRLQSTSLTEEVHPIFSLHPQNSPSIELNRVMAEFEKGLFLWAYEKARHNQGLAAQLLHIPRSTFQYRWSQLFKP